MTRDGAGVETPGADTREAATPDADDAADADADAPLYRVADVVDPGTVRHAPRFGRFILVGILVGALLSFLLTLVPGAGDLARSDLFWLLFISFGSLGALGGAVVALWLDRRSLRGRAARPADAAASSADAGASSPGDEPSAPGAVPGA